LLPFPGVGIMLLKPPPPTPDCIRFPVLPGVGIIAETPPGVGIMLLPLPGVGIILDAAPGVAIMLPKGAEEATECGCCLGTMRLATDCSRCSKVFKSAYSSYIHEKSRSAPKQDNNSMSIFGCNVDC
jgi:hypothetical protein